MSQTYTNLPNSVQYGDLVAADANVAAKIWAQKVIRNTQQKDVFKDFSGEEGSNKPCIVKRDLTKNVGDTLVFTNTPPILGQGVLGEAELQASTAKLGFNTFSLTVDLMRNAVSYTQLIKLLRLTGKTLPQLSSSLMGDWWAYKSSDDKMITLRERARLVSPGTNLIRINSRASELTLLSSDTLSTTNIELSKSVLMGLGAKALNIDAGNMGSDIPSYLYFAPDHFIRPARQSSAFATALNNAGVRGDGNSQFSGKYPLWDNNVIYPHNIAVNAGNGRQGSPLAPLAFLGTALVDATPTTITGGGVTYAAGIGDYFAFFPGFGWKITNNQTLPTDSGTYYAMIYNQSTDGKYEIISYQATGVHATGKQLTTVIRGTTTGLVGGGTCEGNVSAQAASRFSTAHPSGALIVPCSRTGVPLGWALHMGAEALYHGIGGGDNQSEVEEITQDADFGNQKGVGVQGVRGMTAYVDYLSRAPNFVLVQGACLPLGIAPVAV